MKRIILSSLLALAASISIATCNNAPVQANAAAPVSETKKPIRVYVDMIGDLFHAGHIAFIQQARQFGDYLIVGLCNDAVSTAYKRKPILTQEERAIEVAACRYVDEVLLDAPLVVTNEFIKEHQIDIIVHGSDYTPEQVRTYYGAALDLGIYRTVPYTKGISTSEIIKRIRSRTEQEVAKK
jgi:cytidyltransferase-like protein